MGRIGTTGCEIEKCGWMDRSENEQSVNILELHASQTLFTTEEVLKSEEDKMTQPVDVR